MPIIICSLHVSGSRSWFRKRIGRFYSARLSLLSHRTDVTVSGKVCFGSSWMRVSSPQLQIRHGPDFINIILESHSQ